jgi:replication factor A1
MMEEIVGELHQKLPHVKREEIEERVELLLNKFQVSADEAKRSILNLFGKTPSKIADINEAGKWITLRARVLQLWEPRSESISQVGLLGDETGRIKFVSWSASGLPLLEEGKSYELQRVVTDKFQDKFSIKLTKNTLIYPIEDVEIKSQAKKIGELKENEWITLRARVLQLWNPTHENISQVGLLADDTGIIKFTIWKPYPKIVEEGKSYEFVSVVTQKFGERLSIRILQKSEIVELEEDMGVQARMDGAIVEILQTSEDPLSVKAVLDNGEKAQDIILLSSILEKIGIKDSGKAKEYLIGRYFSISGKTAGRYLVADSIQELQLNPDEIKV